MSKRLLILIVILIVLLIVLMSMGIFSFLNKNKEKVIKPKTFSDSGVIFPESYDIAYMVQEKRFTPSNDDIEKAEKILREFLSEKNLSIYSKISQYKKQYFGLINKDNEKIIYINAGIGFEAFGKPDWKKDYIHVDDGGDNFFNVKVNLEQNSCFDFYVNGEA